MSNEKKDGGPAFPNNGEQFVEGIHGIQPQSAYGMQGDPGMTLRDYFAAKAMHGAMANTVAWFDISQKAKAERVPPEVYAADAAYRMADAMLKAREE